MEYEKLSNIEKIKMVELAIELKRSHYTGGGKTPIVSFEQYVKDMVKIARDIAIQV